MNENPFRAMLEWFDGGDRWIQGGLYRYEDGNHRYTLVGTETGACLAGCFALIDEQQNVLPLSKRSAPEQQLYGQAVRIVARILLDQYRTAHWTVFNDAPERTWADIEAVLEKAAVRWDEHYG